MELWRVKTTLLSLTWTMRPLLLANTLANSFQIPPSPPSHDYVWKRSLKRAGSSGKGELHMDHGSGQALWHPSRSDRAQENGEVWLWWPSYHITMTARRRRDSSHRGAAVCGHGKHRLCPLQWNNQQAAVLLWWASVMYCQASGERIQTMGMKLRFTGHSSQWGRSLPQDRQKSNTMGHKQIMRFLQCPGRFSDVYVGWTDDGRCWTEVGLDEWATGEGNLVHIELAFWHFIANCQQALCIYYRKQHIPTE